ncbi:LysM peptidoglycan-binding domain-containing protein [Pseudomonas stutzeri]|uniref:LysM peptidoglycan-binding domain-containing protein n=1 Tax=Stutzerimonas stutzeri TaxID=316 RepID=UPI00210BD1A8|nr:LysM domain-containing protein [Stutzerimonas stutzeri]MCQ4293323.1 LysM peptidoglycan-binding domain-containing protein [Stutzerimonas stutzeri]
MTTTSYLVRAGDTLGSIAKAHGTSPADIQAANPIIRDRDRIQAGWKLSIPGTGQTSASANTTAATPVQRQKTTDLPPPQHAGDCSSSSVKGAPPCSDEVLDVVHFTGDGNQLFVLTEAQSRELISEVDRVQALMDEFHGIVAAATGGQCVKTAANPEAACSCAACKKREWAKKAEEAGLLELKPVPPPPAVPDAREAAIQAQIAELQQARDFFQEYGTLAALRHGHIHNSVENNWRTLCARKVAQIEAEIAALQARLPASTGPKDSETFAGGGKPDTNSAYSRSRSVETGRGSATRHGIREVIIFSRPDRRYYVSARFMERVTTRWNYKLNTQVMREKPFGPALARELMDEIKKQIGESAKAGPLGKLEGKLSLWKSQDDNLLNTLHQELYKYESTQRDNDRFALSAEAHSLRFAASASAGIRSFNPKKGEIDVGVKCEAAFSLAEGKVTTTTYFPNRAGSTLQISYRNALGQPVRHSFGSFRLNGSLELSCFAGVKGGVEAGVKTGKGAAEGPSGALALLGAPSIDASRAGGRAGVKAEGFAGAEAGGALSGAVEWLPPADFGKGSSNPGALTSGNSNWNALAQIKAEGNVAFGIGAEADFGISMTSTEFAIHCKANLVFGPGAGGGFGTVVDLGKAWDLIMLVCDTLSAVEYRHLIGIESAAFNSISRILYKAALAPGKAIDELMGASASSLNRWWLTREAGISEAALLTRNILANRAVNLGGRLVSIDRLPPETLGPILWLLTETYIGVANPDQEKAIVELLSRIRRWRHLLETLEHMSKTATKVDALDSLNRLNSFLVDKQQEDFNRYLDGLALHGAPAAPAKGYAWNVQDSMTNRQQKITLLASVSRQDNRRHA